jgi:hypothetical protein
MRNLLLLVLLTAGGLSAQTVALSAIEKEFQDAMAGVVLEGQSTRDGTPGLSEDKYAIEKDRQDGR